MNRYGPSAVGRSKASPQTLCQKCLQRDEFFKILYACEADNSYDTTATNASPPPKIDRTSLDRLERSSFQILGWSRS